MGRKLLIRIAGHLRLSVPNKTDGQSDSNFGGC